MKTSADETWDAGFSDNAGKLSFLESLFKFEGRTELALADDTWAVRSIQHFLTKRLHSPLWTCT